MDAKLFSFENVFQTTDRQVNKSIMQWKNKSSLFSI